jgi:multiple sugar transport system permease protein
VKRVRVGTVLLYAALIAGALLSLFPILWMISASFMPTGMANTFPPRLLPDHPTIQHYRDVFTRLSMGRYLVNSGIIAIVVTVLSLIINSMAGYAFAKLRFRGRDGVFRAMSAGLVIPVQVAMLPLFLLMKSLHQIN